MKAVKKKPGPQPRPRAICAYPGCTEPVRKLRNRYHSPFHKEEHMRLLRLTGERNSAPREDHHSEKNHAPAALRQPVQPPPAIFGAPIR